jgi:phosphoserine phosphatase RsbU/P
MQQSLTEILSADILPCGIISVNDEGRMQFVNEHLCGLLGYTKEELQQEPIEKIFTIASKIFYQTHLFPMIRLHHQAEEIFLSLRCKEGSDIAMVASGKKNDATINWVFLTVKHRKKYEEEILSAKRAAEAAIEKNEHLIELKNQTELQLAESDRQLTQLKQFNKEYVELSKIISHDLHEPIRKLMVQLDLLMSMQVPDRASIHQQSRKMMEFTGKLRLLTFCLQEYVSFDINPENAQPINLNEIVHNCFTQVQKEEAIEAELEMDELPVIQGYPSQLQRLFTELFNNSFKFRDATKILNITIRSTVFSNNIYQHIKNKFKYLNFVRIDVQDNGTGFPADYSEYIFEMFKKAHPEKDGAGFGLAICKKIVSRHHGTISAKAVNEGTIISIKLPLSLKEL